MAQGGPRAAVPLQRGLARILLGLRRPPGGHRGLPRHPQRRARRRRATASRSPRSTPSTIRSARSASYARCSSATSTTRPRTACSRRSTAATGEIDRATRVLTALDLLGFAEEADRQTPQRLKAARESPAAAALARRVQPRAAADHDGRARAARRGVRARSPRRSRRSSPQPSLGENLAPVAERRPTPGCSRSRGRDRRPVRTRRRGVRRREGARAWSRSTAFPRRLVVIDRTLLAEERRCRCGSCSATRSSRSAAAMPRCSSSVRASAASSAPLLRALLAAGEDPAAPAAEIVNAANPARHEGPRAPRREPRSSTPGRGSTACWRARSAAGLLACDDFACGDLDGGPAGRRDAWPATTTTVALGSVLGGPDLVRFYLSDDYQHDSATLLIAWPS